MHKKCTYINDKVVIVDDNGNEILSDNYDNLENALIQENVIEQLEKEKESTEKKCREFENVKEHYFYFLFTVFGVLFGFVVAPIFTYLLTFADIWELTTSVFGTFPKFLNEAFCFSIVIGVYGALLDFCRFSLHSTNLKMKKGYASKLALLEKQLVKEKEKLISLQKEKKKVNEACAFTSKSIDCKKELEAIREYLNVYYNIGSYEKDALRDFKNGELDKKLADCLTSNQIEDVKQYIKKLNQ